jgi:hypothetical protein
MLMGRTRGAQGRAFCARPLSCRLATLLPVTDGAWRLWIGQLNVRRMIDLRFGRLGSVLFSLSTGGRGPRSRDLPSKRKAFLSRNRVQKLRLAWKTFYYSAA